MRTKIKRKPKDEIDRRGMIDNCQACDKEYEVKTRWQRFCSTKCRTKANETEKTWQGHCPNCGEFITVKECDNQRIKPRRKS